MIHPDFGLPVRYSTEVVGGGPDEQVERTIFLMGKYVLEDLRDPLVESAADRLNFVRLHRWIRY